MSRGKAIALALVAFGLPLAAEIFFWQETMPPVNYGLPQRNSFNSWPRIWVTPDEGNLNDIS